MRWTQSNSSRNWNWSHYDLLSFIQSFRRVFAIKLITERFSGIGIYQLFLKSFWIELLTSEANVGFEFHEFYYFPRILNNLSENSNPTLFPHPLADWLTSELVNWIEKEINKFTKYQLRCFNERQQGNWLLEREISQWKLQWITSSLDWTGSLIVSAEECWLESLPFIHHGRCWITISKSRPNHGN